MGHVFSTYSEIGILNSEQANGVGSAETLIGPDKMPGKCTGYRPGIPQQPYTKWDTDKDEVEVDYKQLDDKRQSWFAGRKGFALKVLIVLVVFSLGLITGYVLRRSVHGIISCDDGHCPYMKEHEDYSLPLSEKMKTYISASSIEENLRNYTDNIHLTGTSNNNNLGNLLRTQMAQMGLTVKDSVYRVFLSYSDFENANAVYLLNSNGTVMHRTEYKGPHPQHHYERAPYNAYAPNGTVEGEPVYANFGEEQDFLSLEKEHVNCSGQIVIMRLGRIAPGQKVRNAERRGAIGVISYTDPAEVSAMHVTHGDLFPKGWWLPPWAVQRGSVRGNSMGDPSTPDMPSIEGIYKLSEDEMNLPKIPVHSLSYDDAHDILLHMGGPAKQKFFGSMHKNISYYVGPGYEGPREGWKVRLEVNNEREYREITNILGVLPGSEEPDRYVIVGSNYDAWAFGGLDPNSGTAIVMELAKALTQLNYSGWKPKRTMIFAHWDGGEQGNIGAYEWVEQNAPLLARNTIAYVNLGGAVGGNHTLKVSATPLLRNPIMKSSKMVSGVLSRSQTHPSSLYEQWTTFSPVKDNKEPLIEEVDASSDGAPFVYRLGVPVLYPQFWFNNAQMSQLDNFPGYHTTIDNFTLVHLVDPGFKAHVALAQMVGDVVLQLVSSARLPFDCREYQDALGDYFNSLKPEVLTSGYYGLNKLDYLQWAIGNFTDVCNRFTDEYYSVPVSDVLKVKRLNERLMQLSRAFLNPDGIFDQPSYKNVLFAPSTTDQFKTLTFTGVRDAVKKIEEARDSKTRAKYIKLADKEVSIATLAVMSAGNVLQDSIVT